MIIVEAMGIYLTSNIKLFFKTTFRHKYIILLLPVVIREYKYLTKCIAYVRVLQVPFRKVTFACCSSSSKSSLISLDTALPKQWATAHCWAGELLKEGREPFKILQFLVNN